MRMKISETEKLVNPDLCPPQECDEEKQLIAL